MRERTENLKSPQPTRPSVKCYVCLYPFFRPLVLFLNISPDLVRKKNLDVQIRNKRDSNRKTRNKTRPTFHENQQGGSRKRARQMLSVRTIGRKSAFNENSFGGTKRSLKTRTLRNQHGETRVFGGTGLTGEGRRFLYVFILFLFFFFSGIRLAGSDASRMK